MKLFALVSIIAFLIVDCRDVHDGGERRDSVVESQQLKEITVGRERRESVDKVQYQDSDFRNISKTREFPGKNQTVTSPVDVIDENLSTKIINNSHDEVFTQRTDAVSTDKDEDGYAAFMYKKAPANATEGLTKPTKSDKSPKGIDLALAPSSPVTGWCPNNFVLIGDCCYWFSSDVGLALPWTTSRLVCEALGSAVGLQGGLADFGYEQRCTSNVPLMEMIAAKDKSAWLGAGFWAPLTDFIWVNSITKLSILNPFWWLGEPNWVYDSTCVMAEVKPSSVKGNPLTPARRAQFGNDPCSDGKDFVCQLFY